MDERIVDSKKFTFWDESCSLTHIKHCLQWLYTSQATNNDQSWIHTSNVPHNGNKVSDHLSNDLVEFFSSWPCLLI